MKRISLLIAALVPVVATAGAEPATNVNAEELRDDVKVTSLLGTEVKSEDDQAVGAIEDVILNKDGKIVSVIVQREGDAAGAMENIGESAEDTMASAEESWDDATGDRDRATRERAEEEADVDYAAADDPADQDEMEMDVDRADTVEAGDSFVEVDWSKLTIDSESETARLSGSTAELQAISYDQGAAQADGNVRASDLVGMEVNLSDEESFGEVEDVLINTQEGKASAIVVDSMEFFDKERFALPVDLGNLNAEEEELTLQYSAAEIEQMEEFEMEEDNAEEPAEQVERTDQL